MVGCGWGWGLGLQTHLAVGPASDLVVELGVDHFGAADLAGHDTVYSADGLDVNSREDYTYADAEAAVARPGTQAVALVGVRVGL